MSHDNALTASDLLTIPAGREGSDEACAILRLLWRLPGIASGTIQTLTGLDEHTTRAALAGLRYRNRAICTGRGGSARWYLPQHDPAHQASQHQEQRA